VRVTFWGTRGSLAAAGPATVRYGGNTACVALEAQDAPLVILDAGSGIRALGGVVAGVPGRIDVLLTHLHMDHIQGLRFFAPLFQPGRDVHIWGPPSSTMDLRARLTRYLSPPLFPVGLGDMSSDVTLHDAPTDGPFRIGPLTVTASLVIHPGPTLGYRIDDGRATLAYLPDHEPALGMRGTLHDPRWLSGAELADGADLLIHDGQYLDVEYQHRVGWGHSTCEHAVALATAMRVRRLALFHHDPGRDDVTLDRMVAQAAAAAEGLEVMGAPEGLALDLG